MKNDKQVIEINTLNLKMKSLASEVDLLKLQNIVALPKNKRRLDGGGPSDTLTDILSK